MEQVHECVDTKNFADTSNIITTMNALSSERDTINKISTWPWQPETIRWLFTAMVLPLLMWVAQYFLGKWLVP